MIRRRAKGSHLVARFCCQPSGAGIVVAGSDGAMLPAAPGFGERTGRAQIPFSPRRCTALLDAPTSFTIPSYCQAHHHRRQVSSAGARPGSLGGAYQPIVVSH
jgi:hypothetical protein